MTKILAPDGKAVMRVETDVKKEHESREFRKLRDVLNTQFNTLWETFVHDLQPPEKGESAAEPSWFALRRKVGHAWAEIAHAALKGSTPVEVDPQKMYKRIDAYKQRVDTHVLMQSPLHTVRDLRKHGFSYIGDHRESGRVWLSHECAMAIGSTGVVVFALRHPWQDASYWIDQPWLYMNLGSVAQCSISQWTLGELHGVLANMRIKNITGLSRAEVKLAQRKPDPDTRPKKRWFIF